MMFIAACGVDPAGPPDTDEVTTQAVQSAGIFSVPDGAYVGSGTWTDSTGRSGTLTDTTTLNNLTNTEVTNYSDGRVIQTAITYAQQGGSRYNVTVTIGGQTYTIGFGACSQNQCETSITTAASTFLESTEYSTIGHTTLMRRSGGFLDSSSGVWTFYRLVEVN